MQKPLTIYPIHSGNELDIFSTESVGNITIMNMEGDIILNANGWKGNHHTLDIAVLPANTYIIEVTFDNKRTTRSVFVKL